MRAKRTVARAIYAAPMNATIAAAREIQSPSFQLASAAVIAAQRAATQLPIFVPPLGLDLGPPSAENGSAGQDRPAPARCLEENVMSHHYKLLPLIVVMIPILPE
jgi:hypothetical protein